MGQSLNQIAQNLKGATHIRQAVAQRVLDVKVQLIYAFNGTGKTRLSREFKKLIAHREIVADEQEQNELFEKILYYNAFTEDLFYWNNDEVKLKIQNNSFTN
jgi:hypothetical protein